MIRRRGYRSSLVLAALLAAGASISVRADDLADAQKLYDTGKYKECIEACTKVISPAPASAPATAAATSTAPGADTTPATLPDLTDLTIFILPPPPAGAPWWLLKAQAELQIGKYEDAAATTKSALEHYDD